MEKRIFAAIVISVAFLWIWAAVAPRLFPELAKPKTPPSTTTTAATASTAATTTTRSAQTAAASKPGVIAAAPPVAITPIAARGVVETVVKRPEFIARFSNRGAQLVSFKLTRYRDKSNQPVELIKERPPASTDFPFAIESANFDVADQLNRALYEVKVDESGPDGQVRAIEYRYAAANGVSATKSFRFTTEYLFDFNMAVAPRVPYRTVIGPGLRTLTPEEYDSKIVVAGSGVVQRDGKLTVMPREKGIGSASTTTSISSASRTTTSWPRFAPRKQGGAVLRRVDVPESKVVRKELYAGLNAAADGTLSGDAFFGPKETKLLDRYGLASTLQFGMFGIIARFLLEVLVWINQYTHNYGWAIIVLTILIKVVLYPLQHKSIVSMKKMQKLQPKMEAIKNRYKKAKTDPEQRQKMNVEMMKLYQVEGINPMSGCFPIVLQLPISGASTACSRAPSSCAAHRLSSGFTTCRTKIRITLRRS